MTEETESMSGCYPPPETFTSACETIGIELSETEISQLGRYVFMLLETNKQFNLTAIKEPDAAWMRHVLDSLGLLAFTGEAKTLIDVGSGGGLPGIPIAITQPEIMVSLLETTGKKAKFLERVAKALGLGNVRVLNGRAEDMSREGPEREVYDLVTARAVGAMPTLLELTLPFAKIGGAVLAVKGARAEEELGDSSDALTILGGGEVSLHEMLPGLDDESVVVMVEKSERTPKLYPRQAGIPKKEPL